jgi:hypothetical protein
VSDFFEHSAHPLPERAVPGNPPPWTGRPQGAPLGVAASDLLLARSELASVYVDYVDAYPEGFELEIRAITSLTYRELARPGDRWAPDVFGEDAPWAGDRAESPPLRLLRIGVQFADGRTATSIRGHDRPAAGPVMQSLSGHRSGGRGGSRFDQGYWISPLPPPGPLSVLCEWPIMQIPVERREIDAQLILDAAVRARAMFGDGLHVHRDGRQWRLGTAGDVAWINDGTAPARTITSAIPPVFDAYCTLELPQTNEDAELARHEHAVIELLTRHTSEQPWWLGYLDTGASDVVFPYTPRTTVYYGYGYVLIEAGPQQAAGWRHDKFSWRLPELMFPADRSWLVSTMWDDSWSSIGGPTQLIDRFLGDPVLRPRARRAALGQDPTPPGQETPD